MVDGIVAMDMSEKLWEIMVRGSVSLSIVTRQLIN